MARSGWTGRPCGAVLPAPTGARPEPAVLGPVDTRACEQEGSIGNLGNRPGRQGGARVSVRLKSFRERQPWPWTKQEG